jgi:enoyl-CoA hydratase/carnithine racemase
MTQVYRTLRVAPSDEGVLGVVIDAPPMNLIGPELVRDLVGLLGALESGQETRVVVLESADPDYFVPHVDLTKVAEYTAEAAKAGGPDDASLGMLWHKLSELPVVSIAKVRGPARGAGSELALACDMRFAARENAILGQIEVGVGATPGAGGVQHLARLLGRGRAMEAIVGADDFDAEQAERYGWINRALPGRRPGRVRGPARAAHRIVPCRRGPIGQACAQRADPARRGRDPCRRPAVPPAGRLGHGQKPHGRPVRAGPADPWPARTRPRRPHRSPVTEKQIQRTDVGTAAAAWGGEADG